MAFVGKCCFRMIWRMTWRGLAMSDTSIWSGFSLSGSKSDIRGIPGNAAKKSSVNPVDSVESIIGFLGFLSLFLDPGGDL